MANSNHLAHSFGSRVECGMFQETANETRRLELTYRQANQTVSGMTKVAAVEPRITGEESHRSDMMQERDDLIVLYPLSADFVTNLANPDPPATQELPLAVWEVLIQHVHAVIGSETSFGA